MQGYSGFKKKKGALGSTLTIVAFLHVVAAGGLIWLASTAKGREILAVYKINILNLPLPEPKAPPETSGAKPAEPAPAPAEEEKPAEVPPPAPEPPPPAEMEAEVPSPEPSPPEEVSAESPAEGDSEAASAESPMEVASLAPLAESPEMEGDGPGPAGIAGLPSSPIRLPGSGNPFGGGGGGKGRRFSGYADIVTSEIQKYYKQPSDLPVGIRLAVLFQLRLDEEGKLLEYKLTRSSGNPRFDESALEALSTIKRLRPPPQGMSKTLTVKFFPPTG
ncbi:MAG: TonB family protein [Candidatus Manganitrophaceae bacterium]